MVFALERQMFCSLHKTFVCQFLLYILYMLIFEELAIKKSICFFVLHENPFNFLIAESLKKF